MEKVTFKTRLAKGSDAHTTEATVDFTGCTDTQIKALAMRSIVIAAQALYRTGEVVPAKDTIIVAELLKRERGGFKVTPESAAARINKMSPEDKARILALLKA